MNEEGVVIKSVTLGVLNNDSPTARLVAGKCSLFRLRRKKMFPRLKDFVKYPIPLINKFLDDSR